MRIFITGIEGVLGSTLKDELLERGHKVFGCSLSHSSDSGVTRADVAERRQLARALDVFGGTFDVLYHFAAEFGRKNGQEYYENLWRTNCIGTRNVIEECTARKIKMVFASSSEAYGLSETYSEGQALSEDMLDKFPPQFHNEYALSKYTNERQIFTAARNEGLDAIVLRFFNVYGPPEMYSPYRSVVCQFIYKLLAGLPITVNRGGSRSHLWIDDWARTVANISRETTLMDLAFNKYWPGSAGTPYVPVFNIGGREYESVDKLYERLVEIIQPVNPKARFVSSEEKNSATKMPNNSMAELWLNHKPTTPLSVGLPLTVKWTKERYGF